MELPIQHAQLRPAGLPLAISLALAPAPALSAVFQVTTSNDAGPGSLCQAILDANTNPGPDTILFESTVRGTITLTSGQLEIGDDLLIRGPGAADLAVSGDSASRVFDILNGTPDAPRMVTIEGLTIRDGAAAGAWWLDRWGGGIFVDRHTHLTLIDSTVSGNSAAYGAGLAAYADNILTLTNSRVSDNVASDANATGGGIQAYRSNLLVLTNSTVSGNVASGNYADAGGIHAFRYNTLSLVNSAITGNSAPNGRGGGVFAWSRGNALTLTKSIVSGNSAASWGGGIGCGFGGILDITESTVSGNMAGEDGGGIWLGNVCTLSLANSSVEGNTAGIKGGGVAAGQNTLLIANTRIAGNSVGGSGEGLDSRGLSDLTVTDSTVSDNFAGTKGGGIHLDGPDTLTLTNSTLSGNSVGSNGGGLYVLSGSTLTLTNSTVSANSAGNAGGGVFALGMVTPRGPRLNSIILTNSTFSDNSAASGGGLYARQDNTLTLANSILANSSGGDCVTASSAVAGTFNLIGDAASACGLTNGENDNIVGADPLIDPLADNGCLTPAGNPNGPSERYGCVQTHALQIGSPALDTASAADAPETDQRGAHRPQGFADDIGAFELGPPAQPTKVAATAGVARATISWTPPSHTGLGDLVACTVTADPGGARCTAPAGTNQCVISGLTPGTDYTFTVSCTNDTSIEGFTSAASDPVTPAYSIRPKPVPALSGWGLLVSAGCSVCSALGGKAGRRAIHASDSARR